MFAAGVAETDVFEPHAGARVGTLHAFSPVVRNRLLQVFVQIGQVQVVLVHAADRFKTGGHRGLSLFEQQQVHGHLSQTDDAANGGQCNPGIGSVKGCGAEQAEQETPEIAPQGQAAILVEESGEDIPIASQQPRGEVKEFDLLDVVLAGEHRFEVGLHACFRRAETEQAEFVAGEFGLGKKFGDSADDQDQHGQRRKMDQQDRIADQRNGILDQAESPGDQTQRPGRGFPAGADQFVVEFGILELRQAQLLGLFKNQQIDALSHQRAQQGLAGGNTPLRPGDQGDDAGFTGDKKQDQAGIGAAGLPVLSDGRHHAVDD